jgi:hypothetical protein
MLRMLRVLRMLRMLLDLVLMQTRRMKRDLFDEMRVRKDLLVHMAYHVSVVVS